MERFEKKCKNLVEDQARETKIQVQETAQNNLEQLRNRYDEKLNQFVSGKAEIELKQLEGIRVSGE